MQAIRREFNARYEMVAVTKGPITEPGRVSLRANAILLFNNGTVTAYMDGFAVPAGSSQMLGLFNDKSIVKFDHSIKFGTDNGADPYRAELHIMEMNSLISGSDFRPDNKIA